MGGIFGELGGGGKRKGIFTEGNKGEGEGIKHGGHYISRPFRPLAPLLSRCPGLNYHGPLGRWDGDRKKTGMTFILWVFWQDVLQIRNGSQ
jgi:hypothetical protein